jgi:hypothetical protein
VNIHKLFSAIASRFRLKPVLRCATHGIDFCDAFDAGFHEFLSEGNCVIVKVKG